MIKEVEEKKRMTVAGFLLPNDEEGVQMIVSPPPVDVASLQSCKYCIPKSPAQIFDPLGPR